MADLVLAEEPSIDFDGYMYWRARNDGEQPIPANTSMGDYDIHDRETHAIKVRDRRSPLSEDLQPGDAEGYRIDLGRLTQNDGTYTLALTVGDDRRLVDYDVVIGRVVPR